MNFYFAPLEGLTTYVYRKAHRTYFGGISKYFSPFIIAGSNEGFKTRELNEILPENNEGIHLIPQILTNNAKDFIFTSRKIAQMGYNEINLNLGCPSGTVVSKNRGSGFLAKREELDAFLEEIYTASVTKISIKTRIGKAQPEEFYELIKIFNKYPLEELIIHPRVQSDFYKNKPNLGIFKEALSLSENPVCYNGDIFSVEAYRRFTEDFPEVDTIMIGRGLLTNPGLISDILYGTKLEKNLLKALHDEIYNEYKKVLYGDRNILFKMKELWVYMLPVFSENSKYAKKIKKDRKSVV